MSLKVNGEVKQQASTLAMIWPVADIICELSKLFELAGGDLIYTGTPSGVGAVELGDILEAQLAGITSLRVQVV